MISIGLYFILPSGRDDLSVGGDQKKIEWLGLEKKIPLLYTMILSMSI